jgi:hypothetical protein
VLVCKNVGKGGVNLCVEKEKSSTQRIILLIRHIDFDSVKLLRLSSKSVLASNCDTLLGQFAKVEGKGDPRFNCSESYSTAVKQAF